MAETFEERLCEQVRNYKYLHDDAVPLHSDKYACSNSWQEISKVLGVEVETCKAKFATATSRLCTHGRKWWKNGAETVGKVRLVHQS